MKPECLWKRIEEYADDLNVCKLSVLFDLLMSRIFCGFTSDDYFVNTGGYTYRFFQKRKVFSYKRRVEITHNLDNIKNIHLIEDKSCFLKHFTPLIKRGWCYPKEVSFEDFKRFVQSHDKILCKPVEGKMGSGVNLYSRSYDLFNDYEGFVTDNILLEELIEQDERMVFNNLSVNTVRIYTILDKEGKPHVLKAVLRAGVGRTLTDNYHTGGVIYPVNIDAGFVESYGYRRGLKECVYVHPKTNKIMLGFTVPYWDEILSTVRQAATMIPDIRYVGWDIAVTKRGIDIVEGNADADHALFERVGNSKFFWPIIKKYAYGK